MHSAAILFEVRRGSRVFELILARARGAWTVLHAFVFRVCPGPELLRLERWCGELTEAERAEADRELDLEERLVAERRAEADR